MRRGARLIAVILLAVPAISQTKFDPALFDAMRWRSIGPDRGGRVTAVAGVAQKPLVYYFGATGGAVWKTEDGGLNWNPVSDGYFKSGSIGAIEVAGSDPNVIYVGTGESCVRSNFAEGDGVYKSFDAGQTWTHIGLTETTDEERFRQRRPELSRQVECFIRQSRFGRGQRRHGADLPVGRSVQGTLVQAGRAFEVEPGFSKGRAGPQ